MRLLIVVMAGIFSGWALSLALELSLSMLPFPEAPTLRKQDTPATAQLRRADLHRLLALPVEHGSAEPAVARPTAPFTGRLLGTLISERGPSLATLVIDDRARTVRVGDQVLDAEIVRIERGLVVVRRSGIEEQLTRHAGERTPESTRVDAVSRVARREALALLGDTHRLMREVRVTPIFQEGSLAGFMFASISDGSFLLSLDLRPGDIVRAINGRPLKSLPEVLALAGTLPHASTVTVELIRDGQPFTHRFELL